MSAEHGREVIYRNTSNLSVVTSLKKVTLYFLPASNCQQPLEEGWGLLSFSPFNDEMLTSLILFRSSEVSPSYSEFICASASSGPKDTDENQSSPTLGSQNFSTPSSATSPHGGVMVIHMYHLRITELDSHFLTAFNGLGALVLTTTHCKRRLLSSE